MSGRHEIRPYPTWEFVLVGLVCASLGVGAASLVAPARYTSPASVVTVTHSSIVTVTARPVTITARPTPAVKR